MQAEPPAEAAPWRPHVWAGAGVLGKGARSFVSLDTACAQTGSGEWGTIPSLPQALCTSQRVCWDHHVEGAIGNSTKGLADNVEETASHSLNHAYSPASSVSASGIRSMHACSVSSDSLQPCGRSPSVSSARGIQESGERRGNGRKGRGGSRATGQRALPTFSLNKKASGPALRLPRHLEPRGSGFSAWREELLLRSVLAWGSGSSVLWGGALGSCFTFTVGSVTDSYVLFSKFSSSLWKLHMFSSVNPTPKLNEATSFNLDSSIFIPTVMISYGSEALIGSYIWFWWIKPMETNLLLSARGEYMVDRIFQSMDSDGKNNTKGIHGDGKAGST